MSIMHENSFIKTFDEYFQKTLIPAYEKLTGVKIKYELVSVGGLQTRVTTVAETGTGPDMTLNFFNWPFLYDEKYVDVGDVAEEAGKKNGGWHDAAKEAVIVNGKWKAIPFGNVGQLMNWRTDWFKEAGYDKFPDTWEELLVAGIKLKANGHPFLALSSATVSATTTAGSIRCCGPMAGARWSLTAKPWSSIRRRRHAPSILPARSSRRPCLRTCLAGPIPITTRLI
jgi:ABC-type glycerol-3-phosphate transport system substrate-binding protein